MSAIQQPIVFVQPWKLIVETERQIAQEQAESSFVYISSNSGKEYMKKGFTLMEILIAISIIAILTAIGIVSYASINRNARNAKRKSDVEQMRSALELYRADTGHYPSINTTLDDASNLENDTAFVTYMDPVPTDPKGEQYQYLATDLVGSFYYGYCLAATMEPLGTYVAENTCSITTPDGYNYLKKNP